MNTRPRAPGLKFRKRATGPDAPVWYANEAANKAGYQPKSVNLGYLADNPLALVAKCETLQTEMLIWMREQRHPERKFNGTFKALFELYQTDPQSPYRTDLKPGTVKAYTIYLRKLIRHIGACYIEQSDGRDVMEWFSEWRIGPDGKDQLAAACMALSVVKAAVSFGIVCRKPGVKEFKDVLGELEFPHPRSRKHAPTAEQIIAARLAAHKHGRPRRALLYALQFETTGRQWDFIGGWWPIADSRISAVVDGNQKWLGPYWSDIDDKLTLTIRPTKTENSTAVEITYDLAACPMVMEELAHFPLDARAGPLILNEGTGKPYRSQAILDGWRKDYKAAGIPEEVWNRDTRAGGITEGRLSGASKDDRRRLAGHADEKTTDGYERAAVDLDAHRKVMAARRKFREQNRP
jgi:hypothetical protein